MADKLKGIAKGGWHPGKDKGNDYNYGTREERWRKNYKGLDQVANRLGRNSTAPKSDYKPEDHTSTPLSALKDPSTFGPPPKRTGTGDSFGSGSRASPSTPSVTNRAGGGGLGAATSQDHINAARERREQEQREAEEEAELQANAPPVPYKTDTTGLSTTGLPPPPKFRGEGVASPPAGRPTPSLPPRLPARASAGPPPPYQEAAPARPDKGILNQGALNRLGKAGVNVQGFGIGNNHASARPAPALPNKRSQVLELTSSNFDGAVFRPGKATLVDFYAPFCKYCKEFDSVLEELAASYGSVQNQITFAKVDAHKYTDIKARYGIEGYPTIMLFDGSSDAPEQFQWKRDLEWLQRFIREQTEIEPSASSAPATAPAQAQAQASPSSGMGFGGQMSELQARFARMGSNSSNGQTAPLPTAASFPASPTKKRPPPPPPKKKELHGAPPPVPLASKPR